jgi:hypothetical protein
LRQACENPVEREVGDCGYSIGSAIVDAYKILFSQQSAREDNAVEETTSLVFGLGTKDRFA